MQATSRSCAVLIAAAFALAGCGPASQPGEDSSQSKDTKPASLTNPVEISHGAAPEGAELHPGDLPGALFSEAQLVIVTDEEHLPSATSAAVALGAPVLPYGENTGEQLTDLGARYAIALGTEEEMAGQDVLVLEESQIPDMVGRLDLEPTFAPVPENLAEALTQIEPGTLYMADPDAPQPTESAEPEDGAEAAVDPTAEAAEQTTEGAAKADEDATEVDADEENPATKQSAGEEAGGNSAQPSQRQSLPEEIPPLVAATPAQFSLLTNSDDPIAIAQARAAGGKVSVLQDDPRATGAIPDLEEPLVTLFDEEMAAKWQAATSGIELPGGGQLVFDNKRYVALYGNPASPALGVLGEQDTPATVARAAEVAKPYEEFTDDTVIPALEVIVTVASGAAGDDGNYSNEWDPDGFIDLIEAAEEAGQYVILDFQPGRSDFLSQVKQYEKLLAYPHVGVALDPEWRLGPTEMPLTRIGHVEASEVNEVVDYLANYVRENKLPQKALVLHQFQLQMLRDRDQIDISRPELAVVIHADGQGSQGAKASTWQTLHTDAPDVHWGWKNFYDEDIPLLSPEETYQVSPTPDFVSYQ